MLDPITIPCPTCLAPAGTHCDWPMSAEDWTLFHSARIEMVYAVAPQTADSATPSEMDAAVLASGLV